MSLGSRRSSNIEKFAVMSASRLLFKVVMTKICRDKSYRFFAYLQLLHLTSFYQKPHPSTKKKHVFRLSPPTFRSSAVVQSPFFHKFIILPEFKRRLHELVRDYSFLYCYFITFVGNNTGLKVY